MAIKIYKTRSPRPIGPPGMTMTPKEVAHELRISLPTLDRWIKDGKIPAPFYVGKRFRRWKRETIEAWIAEQAATANPDKS